jgi:tetratricopeptide (TPR) repeat protein
MLSWENNCEGKMSLPVIILFVGIAYVLLVGGLGLFRREGLSMRFAVEAICITGLTSLLAVVTEYPINPVLFLILLYLITMRVRILVDLGNLFARQGKASVANRLYGWARRIWPDATGALILKVNQATLLLQENHLDESIAMFSDVLQQVGQGNLGVKYEAAAHFNLAVAYQRKNLPGKATVEFNAVIDTWPTSLYAHRAQTALDRLRSRDDSAPEN